MTTEVKTKPDSRIAEPEKGAFPQSTPVRVRPVADVYRDEHAARILLDVPGASDRDVEVEVHDGVLSFTARVERGDGDVRVYERAFRLDRRMDPQAIEARMERGVLMVNVPFHEEAKPRRIAVGTG